MEFLSMTGALYDIPNGSIIQYPLEHEIGPDMTPMKKKVYAPSKADIIPRVGCLESAMALACLHNHADDPRCWVALK